MRLVLALACLALAGCNYPRTTLASGPEGETIATEGEAAVIEPTTHAHHYAGGSYGDDEPHWCAVRARYFHGLVAVPCDQIARTTAP